MAEYLTLCAPFQEAEIPKKDYRLIYLDVPYNTGRNDFGEYSDSLSLEKYKEFTKEFILKAKELSSNTTIAIQCDWHSTHIIRTIGDEIFGVENYQNEIIWNYNSGGASSKRLSRKHDTVHVWTVGSATYNVMREPYPHKYTGKVAAKMNPDGRILQDVWHDISFIGTSSSERSGYPTQKPLALLDRIVKLYSNEDDWIIDFMCGSGTLGVSAYELDRNVVLSDRNQNAIDIANERLKNVQK